MKFYEGEAPPLGYPNKLPRHSGERVYVTMRYADLLDQGLEHDEAIEKACGEARIWRIAREMVGFTPDEPEACEFVGGMFTHRYAFTIPDKERPLRSRGVR